MKAEDRQIDLPGSLVALAIAAVAALALWQAREFSAFGSIFPVVIGATLLLACLAIVVRGFTIGAPTKAQFVFGAAGLWRSLALIAVMVVWALALEPAGFAVSSWVCFVGLALVADNRRPTLRRSALYAAVGLALVVGLQLLFGQLLNVRLP